MSDAVEAIGGILRSSFGATAFRVFDLMGVAEERIAAYKKRNPGWVEPRGVFMALMPPPGFTTYSDDIYVAHVDEILERAFRGEDVAEASRAEILAFILHASLKTPLQTNFADAAAVIHSELFPRRVVVDPEELVVIKKRPGVLEAIEQARYEINKTPHIKARRLEAEP